MFVFFFLFVFLCGFVRICEPVRRIDGGGDHDDDQNTDIDDEFVVFSSVVAKFYRWPSQVAVEREKRRRASARAHIHLMLHINLQLQINADTANVNRDV